MATPLTERGCKLLAALTEDGGFTTRDAARRAGIQPGPIASAWVRQDLLYMEKVGLVSRLDDQKPTAWVRTPLGTEAITLPRPDGGRA